MNDAFRGGPHDFRLGFTQRLQFDHFAGQVHDGGLDAFLLKANAGNLSPRALETLPRTAALPTKGEPGPASACCAARPKR